MISLARGTKTNKPTNRGTKYTNKKNKTKKCKRTKLEV